MPGALKKMSILRIGGPPGLAVYACACMCVVFMAKVRSDFSGSDGCKAWKESNVLLFLASCRNAPLTKVMRGGREGEVGHSQVVTTCLT